MYKENLLPWMDSSHDELRNRVDDVIETVLLPESQNESGDPLPKTHLSHLIGAGLIAIVTEPDIYWNTMSRFAVAEQLAFGCLDTWFVITQHWGAANIVCRSGGNLGLFWDYKSLLGVGFGHLRRQHPCLVARRSGHDLVVSGVAPWVTGSSWLTWVIFGATMPDESHVYFRLPHIDSLGYSIGSMQSLAAVRRTDTREVTLSLVVPKEHIVSISGPSELVSQDEVTIVTSMAPILGLTARCLFDWSTEVKSVNYPTFECLHKEFLRLRSDIYGLLSDIETSPLTHRITVRQQLHTLLETVVHVWSLSSGGQSNTAGMPVIRRRQEAAFFRVFQQTKVLKDAAIDSALSQLNR